MRRVLRRRGEEQEQEQEEQEEQGEQEEEQVKKRRPNSSITYTRVFAMSSVDRLDPIRTCLVLQTVVD